MRMLVRILVLLIILIAGAALLLHLRKQAQVASLGPVTDLSAQTGPNMQYPSNSTGAPSQPAGVQTQPSGQTGTQIGVQTSGSGTAPSGQTTSSAMKPGTYSDTITVNGIARTYLFHVPSGYDGSHKVALVVNLHGAFTTATDQERISGFNATADTHGFVVVYPNGVGEQWNDGRAASKQATGNVDDVAFIKALVKKLEDQLAINTGEIFATGISNGGHMSNRLACDASGVFAAVAPVSASVSTDLSTECNPASAVSVLMIDGTSDPINPYDGGSGGYSNSADRGDVLSVSSSFAFWEKRAGCSGQTAPKNLPDRDPRDKTTVQYSQSLSCNSANTAIGLYTIVGGGHTWPGTSSNSFISTYLLGNTTHDIGNEEIWAFFIAHAR